MTSPDLPEFETRSLDVPKGCERCPEVFGCKTDFDAASAYKDKLVQEITPDEFINVLLYIPEGVRLADAEGLGDDEKIKEAAKMMGNVIGEIETNLDFMQESINELTKDCPGVVDLRADTRQGEHIEVTVCRSRTAIDTDNGMEPVAAFVYRRLPSSE